MSMTDPPPLSMLAICTNYNKLIFQDEQTILISAKYNHKRTKEMNLLSSRQFSETFLLDILFKIFLLKMKKIAKFGLNYHRYMVQPLVLRILRCSF